MLDVAAARDGLRPHEMSRSKDALVAGIFRTAIFFLSIPVAFLSMTAAQLLWLSLFLVPALSARVAQPSTP